MSARGNNLRHRLIYLALIFLVSLSANATAAASDQGAIGTLEQAYNWLVAQRLGGSTQGLRVYALPQAVQGPVSVQNWKTSFVLGHGAGWLFFIDDNPQANWEHKCRFVFVGADGAFQEQGSTTPPQQMNIFQEMTTPPEAPTYHPPMRRDSLSRSQGLDGANGTPASKRWAVIISGGYNQGNNHIRYWNDCAFFYQTLIANGFLDENIFVLMADGTDPAVDRSDGTNSPTDLDGDTDADIQYSATHANITTVFNQLAGLLDGDDILYIFATDHGGSPDSEPYDNPNAVLYLWGGYITDTDFATEVNKVTTLATVAIFEQCFSGGMIDNLKAPNRVLMSAARFWELSYAMGPSYTYDEFSYYVTTALDDVGQGDSNSDGVVSMEEAYLYGLANDSRQLETLDGDGDNEGEHPSYYSDPWDLGRKISLLGYDAGMQATAFGGYRQYQVADSFPSGGVAQGWSGDNLCHAYTLPFSFPFFGQDYTTAYVTTNGLLSLDGIDISLLNSVDGLKGKRAIAPLWDDLNTTETYIDEAAGFTTIRWVGATAQDSRPVAFAVRLYQNGNIRFFYGAGNEHTSRIARRDKTIGISKGDGSTFHLGLRNGQPSLDQAMAIEFSCSATACSLPAIMDILLPSN